MGVNGQTRKKAAEPKDAVKLTASIIETGRCARREMPFAPRNAHDSGQSATPRRSGPFASEAEQAGAS
jgi:hypothetical protein